MKLLAFTELTPLGHFPAVLSVATNIISHLRFPHLPQTVDGIPGTAHILFRGGGWGTETFEVFDYNGSVSPCCFLLGIDLEASLHALLFYYPSFLCRVRDYRVMSSACDDFGDGMHSSSLPWDQYESQWLFPDNVWTIASIDTHSDSHSFDKAI